MSSKSNLSTILGFAGATVLAAGSSAFVTDAGLKVADQKTATVQETEVAISERETELPITVEQFTSTKDAFTVKPVSETENKKNNSKTDTDTTDTTDTEATASTSSGGDNSYSGSAEGGSSEVTADNSYYDEEGNYYESNDNSGNSDESSNDGSDTSSESSAESFAGTASDMPGVSYYDEWGGWVATNGDYYDGKGGYYDGDGYHYVGESIATPSGAVDYSSESVSESGSEYEESGSEGTGWDDSYILYDTAVRYLSEDELSDWSEYELAIARNEIFARHGRIFVTDEWSSYFAQKSWYVPQYDNVDDMLNDYEWANLELIMNLEEAYY